MVVYFILISLFLLATSVVLEYFGKESKKLSKISDILDIFAFGFADASLLTAIINSLKLSEEVPWTFTCILALFFIILSIAFLSLIKKVKND